MTNELYDLEEIKRAEAILFEPGDIVEVRALNTPKKTQIGFYSDREKMARDITVLSGHASGVYSILNQINPALLARTANQLKQYADNGDGASDKDIIKRRFLPIDTDPIRPSGISSTDSEHEAALCKMFHISGYLNENLCFPADSMLLADSGNGAHLLIRIDLPNTPESTTLIQKCLKSVAYLFNDEKIQIDTSVYNPARIWKAYGTLACKGSDTPDRPHRIAKLLIVPDKVVITPKELLERLAAIAPEDPKPTTQTRSGEKFDLTTWLSTHKINLKRVSKWESWDKFELECCPFDSTHTGSSVCILQAPNGAIKFKCYHNSCQGKEWADLRKLKEPGYKDVNNNTYIYKYNESNISSTDTERNKNATKNATKPQQEPLSQRVEDWIKNSGGRWFETPELDRDLGITSITDKNNRREIMLRLKSPDRGVIEQHAKIAKQFRFINKTLSIINFKTASGAGILPIKWPLGIEQYVNLFPNNLAVVAGATNAGKTALLLNVVYLNHLTFPMPIYYFCSEMGDVELRERLEQFEGMGIEEWNFKAIDRSTDFADVIVPNCLNIVDYLELTEDLWAVNTHLTAITKKQGNGLSIVALQKKEGAKWGRGQEFSAEKSKLYLSMDKNKLTIEKGKSWANKKVNPNGLRVKFNILKGCQFEMTQEWTRAND